MIASGIRFNDCSFTEPTPLANWTPPRGPGLIVILAVDPNWAPKPYEPLYFGEFGNNAVHDYAWLRAVAQGKLLFVSVLPMPFSTTAQRWTLRNELVHAYNPVCRFDGNTNPPGDLRRKLDEAAFEPIRPRRPIGFMPPAEPAPAGAGY